MLGSWWPAAPRTVWRPLPMKLTPTPLQVHCQAKLMQHVFDATVHSFAVGHHLQLDTAASHRREHMAVVKADTKICAERAVTTTEGISVACHVVASTAVDDPVIAVGC